MKYFISYGSLLTLAFALLAAPSCSREEPAQSETVSAGKTTLSVGLPQSIDRQDGSQPQNVAESIASVV